MRLLRVELGESKHGKEVDRVHWFIEKGHIVLIGGLESSSVTNEKHLEGEWYTIEDCDLKDWVTAQKDYHNYCNKPT
jgi:hypothetical protein